MGRFKLNEVDKVEILTLEDNYIDLLSGDSSATVSRALPIKDMQVKNSILAEHGFSALVKCTTAEKTRTMISDFGFSSDVAARNADALSVDLTEVEAAALSHGHMDHFGGLAEVAAKIGKQGLELVLHPTAFRPNRYLLPIPGVKVETPAPRKEKITEVGFQIVETKEPYSLLDGDVLFLGEIPGRQPLKKGCRMHSTNKTGRKRGTPFKMTQRWL